MIFIPRKHFSWLVFVSTLNIFAELTHSYSLSSGLARSICEQSENYTGTNQIQPPLKSSSMAPKHLECASLVLKKTQPPVVQRCSWPSVLEKPVSNISPQSISGEPTEPGEFPNLITIYIYTPEYPINETYNKPAGWYMRCSGALITEEWLLANSDCLFYIRNERNNSLVRIYAGKYNHTPGTDPDVEQGPSQPVEYIDYPYEIVDVKDTLRFPFVMVKFAPPFSLNERVQVARWPKADEGIPKEPVTLVGWGRTLPSSAGANLREFTPNKLTMNVMDRKNCSDLFQEDFRFNISEHQFCLEDDKEVGISGPTGSDDFGYIIDSEGQKTIAAAKCIWFEQAGYYPPLMGAVSYLREWVESIVGKLP